MSDMHLRTLTYTSRAVPGLTEAGLDAIHAAAKTLNALDGVTGLLIYNGTAFLQTIEGAEDAIADLVARLRADPRHHDFTIRDERTIQARSFPDWNMALATVPAEASAARRVLERRLPDSAAGPTRALMLDMVQALDA